MDRTLDGWLHGLLTQGWAAGPDFLPPDTCRGLREQALTLSRAGRMRAAAIGHGARRQARPAIRGDFTHWLEPPHSAAEQAYLTRMEALRQTCNRRLFLGLDALEAHYALYPSGAAYARHSDNFHGQGARLLSCVLYLNDAWQAGDGGQLRLYLPAGGQVDVMPASGTLACFLSAEFEHEVLPATRPRLSLTGWFRRRE